MLRTKEVTINGKTYKLQAVPFKYYMEQLDRHTNKHGVLMKTPYMESLLEHCVIEPKITLADFDDDFEAGMELFSEVETFLSSKTDPKPVQKESKK